MPRDGVQPQSGQCAASFRNVHFTGWIRGTVTHMHTRNGPGQALGEPWK